MHRAHPRAVWLGSAAALGLWLATGCDVDLGKLWPFGRPPPPAPPALSARPPKHQRTRKRLRAAASASASSAPAASASAPACAPSPAASGVRSSQGPGAGAAASEERFPFEDERYLLPGQSNGGLVYIPAAVPAGASVPLVIFLHGTNAGGPLHRGLGSGAGVLTSSHEIEAGYDLRPVVHELIEQGTIAPVMIGGPSQTRDAGRGHDLWMSFDPGAFVDAVEKNVGDRARVDRERVVVVGHSGAGCSPVGGGLVGLAQQLGGASGRAPPYALVSIDTCLDDWVADAFVSASEVAPVWVYFQTATWERPFEAFSTKFLTEDDDTPDHEPEQRRLVEIEGLHGDAAHNQALPRGLRLALQGLLPPRVCP